MQAGHSTEPSLVPAAEIAVLCRKVASLTVINLQPLCYLSRTEHGITEPAAPSPDLGLSLAVPSGNEEITGHVKRERAEKLSKGIWALKVLHQVTALCWLVEAAPLRPPGAAQPEPSTFQSLLP